MNHFPLSIHENEFDLTHNFYLIRTWLFIITESAHNLVSTLNIPLVKPIKVLDFNLIFKFTLAQSISSHKNIHDTWIFISSYFGTELYLV